LVADARFCSNVDRCRNRPALDAEINAVFGAMSRGELVERLFDAGIAFGSVNSVADLSTHQQLRRAEVDTPSGPVATVAPPVQRAGADVALRPVPALGEHSVRLRQEFGGVN
jgi:crotonobetainyl-CoA:carnitine CoA-transferase CaiB-like acyl-CoA transferase